MTKPALVHYRLRHYQHLAEILATPGEWLLGFSAHEMAQTLCFILMNRADLQIPDSQTVALFKRTEESRIRDEIPDHVIQLLTVDWLLFHSAHRDLIAGLREN